METYLDIITENILREAGFEKMPHGWNRGSVKKFGKTIAKGHGDAESKGFFDRCVARMRGKVKNPEGFCASVKDEASGSTFWRGKGKTPQKAARMVAKHQNV
jgi:hypothetical protein